MRKQTLIGTLGAMALATVASTADAAPPYWQVLQNGYDDVGPTNKNGGPGAEQATTVWNHDADGNVILTTIFMSSYDVNAYWQCRCSALKINKDGTAPELVADRVLLTNNGGNRPCNHPIAAPDGMGYVAWLYGTNAQNGNTRTYANVVSPTCDEMVQDVRISNNDNNNEGAPDLTLLDVIDGKSYFVGGYLSTGGTDVSYARGFHVNYNNGMPVSITKNYLKGIVTPANIGRPQIATVASSNRSLFCAAKGDQRPPEDGVECAWINSLTGDIMWKQYVAESDPANDIYMNQPEIAKIADNLFMISVTQSSGAGKKQGNQKGASMVRLYVVQVSDTGLQIKAVKMGAGNYSTHVGLCDGQYGQGNGSDYNHAMLFEASITGVGAPNTVPFAWDANLKQIKQRPSWAVSPSADGGYLPNLYGANPNDQGREFMRCLGDIPNPAYGVDGAMFSDAQTLFAMPHAGRLSGDIKNSMILGILPGLTDAPVEPEPPQKDPSTGSGAVPPDDGTGGSPSNSGAPSEPTFDSAEGGCAMVPGREGGLGSLLALVGLGWMAARRRREV
jgi:hypothetical protein